jgi:hypothetical protein
MPFHSSIDAMAALSDAFEREFPESDRVGKCAPSGPATKRGSFRIRSAESVWQTVVCRGTAGTPQPIPAYKCRNAKAMAAVQAMTLNSPAINAVSTWARVNRSNCCSSRSSALRGVTHRA